MKNSTNNVVDTIIEAQKNVAEKVNETAKKFYGENPVSEAVEKGTELYNQWLNKQKEAYEKMQSKVGDQSDKAKETASNIQDFFQNWYTAQVNNAKSVWEMNQNFLKGLTPEANGKPSNPFDFFNKLNTGNPFNTWTEGMKHYNNFINQAGNARQWMDLMNRYNPYTTAEQVKEWYSTLPGMFNSYFEVLNSSFSELQKNFNNNTAHEVYTNMASNALSFGKFVEMWAPFWKSIQEKTFDAEAFKKALNIDALKELTDSMFGLMPESMNTYYTQMLDQYKEGFKAFNGLGKEGYAQAKDFFAGMNPFNQFNPFSAALDNYTRMNEWYQSTVSPIAKLVTPNEYTKNAAAWNSIFDRLAVFSVKNSELQYMMYQQGAKVIEKLADNVIDKTENNTEIGSLTSLYQEWLNLSDSVYVELFESEAYSKLMAEVSALQLKLKKDIDAQLEQYIGKYPVATKSELDELYKVIYDLKKEVRQLEKMLELNEEEETVKPARATTTNTAATAKKASRRTTGK